MDEDQLSGRLPKEVIHYRFLLEQKRYEEAEKYLEEHPEILEDAAAIRWIYAVIEKADEIFDAMFPDFKDKLAELIEKAAAKGGEQTPSPPKLQ